MFVCGDSYSMCYVFIKKLVAELKALEGDYENMKTKAEASKARQV